MNILSLKKWLSNCAQKSKLKVKIISTEKSLEWLYSKDEIKHKSNRFFKVIAVEWKTNLKLTRQLLIEQKEIGILGFIIFQSKSSNYILIQAKVEPGNVRLAQIAPSCQATSSNLDQVHGGSMPLYADYFKSNKYIIANSSLQSEQGTRFLGKRNKNMTVFTNSKFIPPFTFKWVKVRTLCQLLSHDYTVNTDSRSVLVTSNWQKTIGGDIFVNNDKFTQDLKNSLLTSKEKTKTDNLHDLLKKYSQKSKLPKIIPLEKFENSPKNNSLSLIHILVNVKNREVDKWDQPILKSKQNNHYYLYCGRLKGVLYFYFEFWHEPGLYNQVELGPARQKILGGKVIKHCWQSDEGGRFYKDKGKYYLVDLGQIKVIRKDMVYLTLKQVQLLAMEEGIFCNEARSSISLILSMI